MLNFTHLTEVGDQPASNLTWAQQKRLMLATALATKPKLILLDEPVAGMNADEIQKMIDLIATVRKGGITVFIIDHNMRVMMRICDRLLVMNYGQKLTEGFRKKWLRTPGSLKPIWGIKKMIHLKNIDIFYGKSQALYGVSLSVRPGEIVALIGANGAGKTTVLKAISGLIPLTSGEILFQKKSLKGLTPEVIAQKGISHVPERGGIFGKMTVLENLELGTVAQRKQAST